PYDQSVAIITDPDEPPIAWLATPINATWLLTAIRTAVELLRAERAVNESRALLQICRAMGSERDVPTLHRLIVRKARELTNADAGTLYLLDDDEKTLRFAVSQTGPHDEERFAGSTVEVSADSIAGHVAMTGESIRIGDAYADLPPSRVRFDASFDKSTEYRTKSVLCVPIRNVSDQIVGVLQLINRKPNFDAVLGHGVVLEEVVMPFDEHDEEIVIALASQAGAVLERH
ncbi:MAG TPA: GAF domain-containing protein, partial [Candidatus Cybelea sp.]|nr:GAF domain-containing protein [Candidatus Cybelea sp.]